MKRFSLMLCAALVAAMIASKAEACKPGKKGGAVTVPVPAAATGPRAAVVNLDWVNDLMDVRVYHVRFSNRPSPDDIKASQEAVVKKELLDNVEVTLLRVEDVKNGDSREVRRLLVFKLKIGTPAPSVRHLVVHVLGDSFTKYEINFVKRPSGMNADRVIPVIRFLEAYRHGRAYDERVARVNYSVDPICGHKAIVCVILQGGALDTFDRWQK